MHAKKVLIRREEPTACVGILGVPQFDRLNSVKVGNVNKSGIMKTLASLALFAWVSIQSIQAYDIPGAYCPDGVDYTTPVIYSAPVVYQAPVNYYAPVYYLSSAASAALTVATERYCSNPSTVIHITGGRGTYVTENCGYSGSSVIVIGSRYARRDGLGYLRTFSHPSTSLFRHSWIR